jgi:alpha-L-rhamnosidase
MPWEAYLTTGDRRILEKTYAAGQKWLSFLDAHVGPDGLLAPLPGGEWYFLGDWAGPYGSEPSNSPEALLFNNCYFLYVSGLAARISHILGRPADEQRRLARIPRLREAINQRFFDPRTAAYLDTKETHCVMPLISGAVPANRVADVMGNLEHEILVAQKGHLATGLHGTYFMTKYLTEAGRSDLVYTYATQTTFPSYGDLLAQGLDTWPEYWRGADSLVHGCLNGIGGWFHRGLAGIRPDAASPGYRHIFIRPAIVGDLTWARCSHDAPYGRIVSNWSREGEALTLEVTIPPNATGAVYLPTSSPSSITESGRPAAHAPGVKYLGTEPGACIFSVQAGNYRFEAPYSLRPA